SRWPDCARAGLCRARAHEAAISSRASKAENCTERSRDRTLADAEFLFPASESQLRELTGAVQLPVEAVDQCRHGLESLRDRAEPIFAEVLGLDLERLRERGHDVVRGNRPVPVHEVVQVAGGKPGARGELAVRHAQLV